jgi:hypothetical protein
MTCTNHQVEILMENINKYVGKKKLTKAAIAAKSGMSVKTARKYSRIRKIPSELKKPRTYRTRTDPFLEHEALIKEMWVAAPELQAKTILFYLMEQFPDKYKEEHLRSLQRRIRELEAFHGKSKEVIFPQDINPGRQSQSDWTYMDDLQITIAKQPFPHLLFHFMLPFSQWEDVMICYTESFETLSKGYAQAVTKLGGCLPEHRTDNLTAATKKAGGGRAFTDRWQQFLEHYKIKPSRNNPGQSHENGSVEKSHDLMKSSINQSLLLRGSRDFADLKSYETFVNTMIARRNKTRQELLAEELPYLQALPTKNWNDPTILNVRVNPSSAIRVLGCTYSVPSRLISYHLRAHAYEERIDLYLGSKLMFSMERSYEESKIDYRHIIDSLIRKPGAFEGYQYHSHLFPLLIFRWAYDELTLNKPSAATKEYLKILQMAKCYGECEVVSALELCKGSRMLPEAITINELVKAPILPMYMTNVRQPNLSEYDSLYSFREAV